MLYIIRWISKYTGVLKRMLVKRSQGRNYEAHKVGCNTLHSLGPFKLEIINVYINVFRITQHQSIWKRCKNWTHGAVLSQFVVETFLRKAFLLLLKEGSELHCLIFYFSNISNSDISRYQLCYTTNYSLPYKYLTNSWPISKVKTLNSLNLWL